MNFIRYFAQIFFVVFTLISHVCYAQPVTNAVRSDGFGAQFQLIIYLAVGAELCNLEYVYSPFDKMEHNYNNDPDFIAKKEWLINFIGNFELNKGDALRIDGVHAIGFFEANLEACAKSATLKKIKRVFRENKKRSDYLDNDHFHIVIHLRRPNPHDNRIAGTDTPDDVFVAIINKLRVLYADKKPLFHIHSQGKRENFDKFNGLDIILHLNESTEDAFIQMVFADVLVTSPSSFGYAAALISEGMVYYMPYWHPPLPGWRLVVDLLNNKY